MDYKLLSTYGYSVGVTLFFIFSYIIIKMKLTSLEKRRVKHLTKREITDAVETNSPVKNNEKNIKELGFENIENRFSFMNRLLPLTFLFLWLIFYSVPHLGKIPTVYVSIVAAMASVFTGLALRPFLENLFSGIVISIFRSVKVGDTVMIDGHYGLIEDIGLTNTILRRWDWLRIVIPNSRLIQKEIQNLTMKDNYLWGHVKFYVSPEADMEVVEKLAVQAAKDSPYFNGLEDPAFWIMECNKDSIECWVAAWSDGPSECWELRHDIRKRIIKELRRNSIQFHILSFHGSGLTPSTID